MALLQKGWAVFVDPGVRGLLLFMIPLCAVVLGLFAFRASRKLMGFVAIAEAIFRGYDWPDVENIDLRKTSKEHRGENRLPNFAGLYFRYK